MKKNNLFSSVFSSALALIFCSITAKTFSQINLLDPNFGSNGIVITKLNEGGLRDVAETSVQQPDGKMVLAGNTQIGNSGDSNDVAVFRFNQDGSADASFGVNGRVVLDANNGSNDFIYAMAIQPDGKFVLAGRTYSGLPGGTNYNLLFIRLLADGTPDNSFSTDGIFIYDYSGTGERINAVSVLPDGKIIAAGYSSVTNMPLLFARLLPDGTPDASFDNDGFMEIANAISPDEMDLTIDQSGRMLISGETRTTAAFGVERYNIDGVPDPAFGSNGLATADFDSMDDLPRALTVTDNQRIVVAGSSIDPSTGRNRVALCRFKDDGTLDNAFGTGGKVITPFPNFMGAASSVCISPTGKIVAGVLWDDVFSEDNGFLLLAYKQNGKIDSSFGTDGFIETKLAAEFATYNSNLYVNSANQFNFSSCAKHGISDYDFFVAQFNENGTRHFAFGNNSVAWGNVIPYPSDERADAITLLENGDMLVAGSIAYNGPSNDLLVAKYNAAGVMDATFGDGGFARIDVDDLDNQLKSVMVNADSSLMAGGFSQFLLGGDAFSMVVIKMKPNGKLDFSFGDHGIVQTTLGYAAAAGEKFVLQGDGKIVGCGWVMTSNGIQTACVFRLLPDGTPDSSFNGNGVFEYELPGGVPVTLSDVTVLNDGSILDCGYHHDLTETTGVLLKLLPDGTLDNSFQADGVVTFTDTSFSEIHSLVVQANNDILLGGTYLNGNISSDFLLFRFLSNGDSDNGFGVNGRYVVEHDSTGEARTKIGLLSDGRIAVTGESYSVSNYTGDFNLAMVTDPGAPDITFGGDGWGSVDLQEGNDENSCITIQPDDLVVVGGFSYNPDLNYDLALARFLTSFPTGISDVNSSFEQSTLSVYPNPAHQSVQIKNPFYDQTGFGAEQIMQVKIQNIFGEVVASGSFHGDAKLFPLSLQNFAPGMYMVEVQNAGESRSAKLVIE